MGESAVPAAAPLLTFAALSPNIAAMAKTASTEEQRRRIVRATLAQADEVGWEGVRLRRVADSLDISLVELRAQFRDQDAVAEAWLAEADAAMLASPGLDAADLPPPERIARAIMRWLDVLAAHKRVAAQMLLGKLYPGHPHYVAGLVFRLSRTVQWLREAARLDAPPPRRQVEEIGLTWLFVGTVVVWARDSSIGQIRTREFLARRLGEADRLLGRCARRRPRAASLSQPRTQAS